MKFIKISSAVLVPILMAATVAVASSAPELTIYEKIELWKDKCMEDMQMSDADVAVYRAAPMAGRVRGNEMALPANIAGLPQLAGKNMLPSLHEAILRDIATGDTRLRDMVARLAALDLFSLFVSDETLAHDFDTLMFLWAAVDNVSLDARGEFIDARQIAFLDRVRGKKYLQAERYFMLAPHGSTIEKVAFREWRNKYYSEFFMQAGAKGKMLTAQGAVNQQLLAALTEGAAVLPSMGRKFRFWKSVVRVVSPDKVLSIPADSLRQLQQAITTTTPGLTLTAILETLAPEVSFADNKGATRNRDGRFLSAKAIVHKGSTKRRLCIKYLDDLPTAADEIP